MTDLATTQQAKRTATLKLCIAFALLYVVWGSTYLAIRIAVRTLPPFTTAGLRFFIAGALPLLVLRACGEPWPSAREWRMRRLSAAV
jgi:drug/metabolite transporter (DMT)-like permease